MAFGDIIKSFPSPVLPLGLAFDRANLWLVDNSSNLYCIDRAKETWSIIPLLIAPSPRGLTFDGKHLWMPDDTLSRTYCIDPLTGADIYSFPWVAVDQWGMTFDGKNLITSDYAGLLLWVDRETGTVIQSRPAVSRMSDLAFDGKDIYTLHEVLAAVDIIIKYSIDGEEIDRVTLTTTTGRGLTYDDKNLWYCDSATNRIYCMSVN